MAQKKLRPKYVVYKMSHTGEETGPGMMSTDPHSVNSPFVLLPRKDPAAFFAMVNYAQVCEPDLSEEIVEWLERIVGVSPAYGTQGVRNWKAMKLKQLRLSL